jgi:hypothetical protein
MYKYIMHHMKKWIIVYIFLRWFFKILYFFCEPKFTSTVAKAVSSSFFWVCY